MQSYKDLLTTSAQPTSKEKKSAQPMYNKFIVQHDLRNDLFFMDELFRVLDYLMSTNFLLVQW